jgi:hypothetical protein
VSLERGMLCWSARALPNLSARFSSVIEQVQKAEPTSIEVPITNADTLLRALWKTLLENATGLIQVVIVRFEYSTDNKVRC